MSRSFVAAAVLACASLWAAAAGAFEIEKSETRYVDRRYQCDLSVKLDAPPDKVEAILRDYERYPSLDTRILRARVMERPGEDALARPRRRHSLDRIAWRTVPRDEPATLGTLMADYVDHLEHHLDGLGLRT